MGDSVLYDLLKPEACVDAFHLDFSGYTLPEKAKRFHSISIVTTCMDRCSCIKQTYKKNIEDSLSYPNVEFVLLNYNSKDDLDDYVRNNLIEYIENGVLSYYKTSEPKYYSMCHSRNIGFKMAKGEIVCSVDADHFINTGFPEKINLLANIFSGKAVFCKSKHKNRGRLCFRKKEFIELLGGYDESIEGYGFDDQDLLCRAARQGFTIAKFGGEFCTITEGHSRHPGKNYKEHWRYTQRKNTLISLLNIKLGILKANEGKTFGKAFLTRNFKDDLKDIINTDVLSEKYKWG